MPILSLFVQRQRFVLKADKSDDPMHVVQNVPDGSVLLSSPIDQHFLDRKRPFCIDLNVDGQRNIHVTEKEPLAQFRRKLSAALKTTCSI